MEMRKIEKLYDRLCDEWDNFADKELSTSTLDTIYKLTGTIHYLDEMMEDGDEYSERGSYRNGGGGGRGGNRSNRDGGSYRGSYRRGGESRRREGRYSGAGDFRDQLEDMMLDAPDESTREAMRRMLNNMG